MTDPADAELHRCAYERGVAGGWIDAPELMEIAEALASEAENATGERAEHLAMAAHRARVAILTLEAGPDATARWRRGQLRVVEGGGEPTA